MQSAIYVFCVLLATAVLGQTQYPANVTEIIRGYGYPVEEHTVVTPDGFVLLLVRIPCGRSETQCNPLSGPPKSVVFLQHGLGDSCVGWTLNPPYQSLSFILADAGYDVWLGNNRGNLYTLKNIYYTPNDTQFWAWSFDEMAKYDLPTQINYVLQTTNVPSVAYVGHSQGTNQAFAGYQLNPELAARVNIFVALAPVAYVGHIRSLLLQALAHLGVVEMFELLGVKEFYELDPALMNKLLPDVCSVAPYLCEDVVSLWAGPEKDLNASRAAYYLHYEPNPTSVQNMAHFAQLVNSGTWQMYDYGSASANEAHYGTPVPPMYNLTAIPSTLPIALFYGGEDYLADPADVQLIMNQLPLPPYVHYQPEYAHFDPLLGMDAYKLIYPQVLQLIAEHAPL